MFDQKNIIQKLISENNIDAMLFCSPENRYWYSDFISTLGYLLITNEEAELFVDGRYITEAIEKTKNVKVSGFSNINQTFLDTFNQRQIKKIGIEAEFITIKILSDWKNQFPNIEFIPISVGKLRMIKNAKAISRIKQACAIGDLAFLDVIKSVKPGMTEKQLEAVIVAAFLKYGAEKPSFETIVASGYRSAMPHGKASDKIINVNEIITCDFGCIYEGYCSDMTRTFALGKINDELIKIHEIVKTAQKKGIDAIKPGIKISDIDNICREYITEQGYGQFFTHGTGHGLGIEIHEAPWVISSDKTILEPGMVITVEPGIYIPKFGGVRIEDDILVTRSGNEVLTKSNRNLYFDKVNKKW